MPQSSYVTGVVDLKTSVASPPMTTPGNACVGGRKPEVTGAWYGGGGRKKVRTVHLGNATTDDFRHISNICSLSIFEK